MDDLDLDYLKEWIGKTERSSDFISEGPAIQLAMTLDRKKVEFKTGDILPPLWHWIYFLPRLRLSELKSDGHGKLGQAPECRDVCVTAGCYEHLDTDLLARVLDGFSLVVEVRDGRK